MTVEVDIQEIYASNDTDSIIQSFASEAEVFAIPKHLAANIPRGV